MQLSDVGTEHSDLRIIFAHWLKPVMSRIKPFVERSLWFRFGSWAMKKHWNDARLSCYGSQWTNIQKRKESKKLTSVCAWEWISSLIQREQGGKKTKINWEEKWFCPFGREDEVQAKFNSRNIVICDWGRGSRLIKTTNAAFSVLERGTKKWKAMLYLSVIEWMLFIIAGFTRVLSLLYLFVKTTSARFFKDYSCLWRHWKPILHKSSKE